MFGVSTLIHFDVMSEHFFYSNTDIQVTHNASNFCVNFGLFYTFCSSVMGVNCSVL